MYICLIFIATGSKKTKFLLVHVVVHRHAYRQIFTQEHLRDLTEIVLSSAVLCCREKNQVSTQSKDKAVHAVYYN